MGTLDLLRVPKLGLGLKRLMIAWLGVGAVYVLHVVGSYLVMWMEGVHLVTAWKLYGLLPLIRWDRLVGLPQLVGLVLVVISLIPLYITALGVVRMTYRQLAGDEFYEVQQALRFALSRGRTLFQTLDLMALAWILVLIPMGVLLLAARLPGVGPVVFVVTLPLLLVMGLLLLYLVVGLGVALLTTPPAVAVARADAFDGIFEALTTLNQQGGRFLLHQGIILGMVGVGSLLFGGFLWGSWELVTGLGNWVGGPQVQRLLEAREVFLGFRVAWTGGWSTWLGLVTALIQVGYFLLVPAYAWSAFWAGQTISFLHIARVKDDLDYLRMEEEGHA